MAESKEVQGVKVKVGMDGADFKKGMQGVNRSLKVAQSEFKNTSSSIGGFKNSTEQLKAKSEHLTKTIGLQSSKVEMLKKAYEKSKKATGEDSVATSRLAVQYNNAQTALNRMQDGLESTNTQLGEQTSKMNKFKGVLGKLNGVSAKVTKGIGIVSGAIGVMGAGALKLGLDLGNVSDRLLDLNSITGMSTAEIQRWQHASVIAGTSQEAVTMASEKLTQTMDSMSTGSGKAVESLESLGLTFEEISNMDADERMNATIESLQQVEDKTERAKIGTDLYGKKWAEIAPLVDLGVQGLKDAKANSQVFSDEDLNNANNFRIAWDNMKYTVTQFTMILASKLIPYFNDFNKKIQDNMPKIQETTKKAIDKMIEIFEGLLKSFNMAREHTTLLKGVVIALGTAFIGLKIIDVISKMITAWTTVTKIATATQAAFNFALEANPIGLVVTAIGALVGALVYLYQNNENVRKGMQQAWRDLMEEASMITNGISSFFTGMGNALVNIGTNIDNKLNLIWTKMGVRTKGIWTGLTTSIKNIFTGLWTDVKNIAGNIKESIQSAFDIKLPKFSLEIGTKTIMGKEIKFPKGFDVSWHAEGGIFTQPTLLPSLNGMHGVGEDGAEAILPLKKLNQIVRSEMKSVMGENQGGDININITGDWTVDNDSRKFEVVDELSKQLKGFMRPRGLRGV